MQIEDMLLQPIPVQTAARERRHGFREYPLAVGLSKESLVSLDTYGIAGQSYYSRPNNATGEAVPGVQAKVYVRQSVAERLAAINAALRHPNVTALFGKPVELYANEGLRSQPTQKILFEDVFPRLIQTQYPGLSSKEALQRRNQLISRPNKSKFSPSPHATGGAVDLRLRFIQANLGYVPEAFVDMGYGPAETGKPADVDYFETKSKLSAKDKLAQRHRRIFYWMMRGALQATDSGFAANPYEWWHWSYGDQMWAALTQAPHAFYDAIDTHEATQ